ncbi:MAG: ornithine cyclodeaminase family protein [Pirellulaceae bacterium]|nr:ornithine cyclodeaminase family protein [Pirellulaceae bacterium]
MRHLNFEETLRAADSADLLGALRKAFTGSISTPPRAHYTISNPDAADGTLLIMPAWQKSHHIGVKMVTVFPDNPHKNIPTVTGVYLLASATTGEPVALINAPALTAVRTAAVSALAADILAPKDAKNFLMIGTGTLSPHMVRAHCKVRNYESVTISGRNTSKVRKVVDELSSGGLPARPCKNLVTAIENADVISCATTSTDPVILGKYITPKSHIDLVGSFRPDMREGDDTLMERAGIVMVDTKQALHESGDLVEPIASGILKGTDIIELESAIRKPPQRTADSPTVFKSVGTALADLAVAEEIISR